MSILDLGERAPEFTASIDGKEISIDEWLDGGWGVLFSYPKAFTSICANELVAVAKLLDDYRKADVAIAAVSADSAEDQGGFGDKLEEEHNCPASKVVQFADPGLQIAGSYGMVHPKMSPELTMRVTYLIDADRKIRLTQAYPPYVERDFAALLAAAVKLRESDG